jgi:HPt (histidine-containing phosphotransfer) domain-containing protein
MLNRRVPARRSADAFGPVGAAAVPAVSAVTPRLDPAALARLRELDPNGHSGLVERVLKAFQGSAMRLRGQAEAARASGDHTTLRLVAHTLKSSAASVGAPALAQRSANVETAIRLGALDGLDGELDAMLVAFDAAQQAIALHLQESRA